MWKETPNATEEKPATTEALHMSLSSKCVCVHAENDSYRVCGPYPQEPAANLNAATAEIKPAAATEQPQERDGIWLRVHFMPCAAQRLPMYWFVLAGELNYD